MALSFSTAVLVYCGALGAVEEERCNMSPVIRSHNIDRKKKELLEKQRKTERWRNLIIIKKVKIRKKGRN